MSLHFTDQLFGEDDFEDIFKDFDFALLDSPDFKEDAVREEIVFPLLKSLGYSASSDNKIIRSKNLKHPFYYFGTKKYNVNIIPDYTFETNNKTRWILDAKRPTEGVDKEKNIFQAYSYAMHPEIQSEIYALCNGYELSVYSIRQHEEPILRFEIKKLKENWISLKKTLGPKYVENPNLKEFRPDFGLHLLKISDTESKFTELQFPLDKLNFIGKLDEEMYSLTAQYYIKDNEDKHFMGSFDFTKEQYRKLLSLLPAKLSQEITTHLENQPFRWNSLEGEESDVNILAYIGRKIISNENESYLPFIVSDFKK